MRPRAEDTLQAPVGAADVPVKEERIHALDSLRAVAMTLGIVVHGACSFMVHDPIMPWPVRDVSRGLGFDLLVLLIHGFRMHLFFLLAGFFGRLLHERLGTRAFVKQRLTRIGLPLLAGPVLLVMPFLFVAVWSHSWLENPVRTALQPPLGEVGPPLGHLWFLQFMLIHYAAALVAIRASVALPERTRAAADAAFARLLRSPLRIVAFVPLTMLCLWNGPFWGEPHYAGAGVLPTGRAIAHYGLFFAVGWWLHRRRELLAELPRFIRRSLAAGLSLMLINGWILLERPAASHPLHLELKLFSLAAAGVYAWAVTFALLGLFLRAFARARAWGRYLADASYWCYLAHPALVLLLQVLLAEWRFPAVIKFALLIGATMGVLLLSYQTIVRYTWIGVVLNGPRVRSDELAGGRARG